VPGVPARQAHPTQLWPTQILGPKAKLAQDLGRGRKPQATRLVPRVFARPLWSPMASWLGWPPWSRCDSQCSPQALRRTSSSLH
jgi:hypothetical protein